MFSGKEKFDAYMQPLRGWTEQFGPIQQHYGDIIKASWPGAAYVVRNSPFAADKMVFCPPNSTLNLAPNQQHRVDYGTGVIEGLCAEPQLDEHGKIVGISVVLHKPRMERFARSLRNRGYALPMPLDKFSQSVLDVVAVHGLAAVTQDDGTPVRLYIRPSAGPAIGVWGLCFKDDYFIDASNIVFRWGHMFADVERVKQHGVKVMLSGAQRLMPITGKHASNYGAAAVDGRMARVLNYDELLYLAPYCIKNGELMYGVQDFSALMQYGVLADGPAEEVFGLLSDGETIVYPPMRVNRLGGTVLEYVVKHLVKELGLRSKEQDITLQQIRDGDIIALGFAGNAVKVTPIGAIDIVQPAKNLSDITTEPLMEFGVHPVMAKIRDQFEAELTGRKVPSHSSLLTPVNLVRGLELRGLLDNYWHRLGFV